MRLLIIVSSALMLMIAAVLSYAHGAGVNLFNNDTGKPIHLLATATEAKDAIEILAFAPDAVSIALKGGGAALVTCPERVCRYRWTKVAMLARKCVACELLATATDSTGATYRIKTEVRRP